LNGYLHDTNVVSETRKRKPHSAVVAWLNRARDDAHFVSAVTFGEIQIGIEKTRIQDPVKAASLDQWVSELANVYQIVPMDAVCFREWARLMVGKSDTLYEDAMIAATARVHDLTVVTRNVRDFEIFGVRVLNPFETGRQ